MKRIKVKINKSEREYDVYALLTSFFPGVEVVTAADDNSDVDGVFSIDEDGENVRISLDFEAIKETTEFVIASKEKDDAKKEFGLKLYDFLSKSTNKELPWGNLTGIRPTKLIRTIYEEECKKEGLNPLALVRSANAANNLTTADAEHNTPSNKPTNTQYTAIKESVINRVYKERRLRGEKLELGIDIATREIDIMSRLHETDGYSVYVGIPFCPSTCLYCSFTSNPIFKYKNKIGDYLKAVKKELEWTASNMKAYSPLSYSHSPNFLTAKVSRPPLSLSRFLCFRYPPSLPSATSRDSAFRVANSRPMGISSKTLPATGTK